MKSAAEQKFEKIFRQTMNFSDSVDVSGARYAHPANWDSIRHVEFFILVQREFKIYFSADEISTLDNYAALVAAFLTKIDPSCHLPRPGTIYFWR